VPLKKFVITHKPLKKLSSHEYHRSELLCSPSHSVCVLFVFYRLAALTYGPGQCKRPKYPSLVQSSCFFLSLSSGAKLSATRLHLPPRRAPASRRADVGVELARPRPHRGGARSPALAAAGRRSFARALVAAGQSSPALAPAGGRGGAALHVHPWRLGRSSPMTALAAADRSSMAEKMTSSASVREDSRSHYGGM